MSAPPKKKRRGRHTLAAIVVLLPIMAVVVYSSFQVSDYQCDVCVAFGGHEICRTVTGKTREEGIRSGIDNACALLAGGVTETMRCARTMPSKAECRALAQ